MERAAAAELVSRGLTGASDAIAGRMEVEGAFGSPASVERPKRRRKMRMRMRRTASSPP